MNRNHKLCIAGVILAIGIGMISLGCCSPKPIPSQPLSSSPTNEVWDPLKQWLFEPVDWKKESAYAHKECEKLENRLKANQALCERVRQWAMDLLQRCMAESSHDCFFDSSQKQAKFVKKLGPKDIPFLIWVNIGKEDTMYEEQKTYPHVEVMWHYGKVGGWGLYLGDNNFQPRFLPFFIETKQIAPGVFVFYTKY